MAGSGVFNAAKINAAPVNGSVYTILVNNAQISIIVNQSASALINQPMINAGLINGLAIDRTIRVVQTHVLTVQSAIITLVSTSPAPVMVFTVTVANAAINIASQKVFITKGVGGNLFVTITEPDATAHRFSFEGIKA